MFRSWTGKSCRESLQWRDVLLIFYNFQQNFGMQVPLAEIQVQTAFSKLKYFEAPALKKFGKICDETKQ